MISSYSYKIGLIGPSRVGKTTIITSILEEAVSLLRGTEILLSNRDTATKRRIQKHKADLQGAIATRSFSPGKLDNTEDPFQYQLSLSVRKDEILSFDFMDYPGGWMIREPDKWNKICVPWIEDSTILIVPIDASVIMESVKKGDRQNIPHLLQIPNVRDVVIAWVKARKQKPSEHSILCFVPLKCESYFADNLNNTDKGKSLETEILEWYGEIIRTPREDSLENCSVFYCPVDSYGCVTLKKAKWINSEQNSEEKEFCSEFMFNGVKPELKRKAVSDLVVILCRHLLKLVQYELSLANENLSKENQHLSNSIQELTKIEGSKGFIDRFIEIFVGNSAKNALEKLGTKQGSLLNELSANHENMKLLLAGMSDLCEHRFERAKEL